MDMSLSASSVDRGAEHGSDCAIEILRLVVVSLCVLKRGSRNAARGGIKLHADGMESHASRFASDVVARGGCFIVAFRRQLSGFRRVDRSAERGPRPSSRAREFLADVPTNPLHDHFARLARASRGNKGRCERDRGIAQQTPM
jgi:hypothetical protein